jgi:hypothetical protein
MAIQRSIIKIQGTIDGITFYKSQDGNLARKKSSLSKHRISTDPGFARTRENNNEFKNATAAGKLFRDTVRTLTPGTADNRVTSRFTKVFMEIKKYDAANPRGQRTVANGISDPAAQDLLRNFDFNINATLSSVIVVPFSVEKSTGNISIPAFIPKNAVNAPGAATHVAIESAFVRLDFANNGGELQVSPVQHISIDSVSTDIVLKPDAIPSLPGFSIYLLKVSFIQLVNGIAYELSDGNALTIVDVA